MGLKGKLAMSRLLSSPQTDKVLSRRLDVNGGGGGSEGKFRGCSRLCSGMVGEEVMGKP